MQKELRRRLDTISILGTGICLFGAWGAAKSIMYVIADRDEFKDVMAGNKGIAYTIFIFLVMVFILTVVLVPHFYIGLSARGEGRREKKHTVYLFATGIMVALYFASVIFSIKELPSSEEPEDVITSIILDITVAITMIQIIINSIKIKRLRKQLNEQEGL